MKKPEWILFVFSLLAAIFAFYQPSLDFLDRLQNNAAWLNVIFAVLLSFVVGLILVWSYGKQYDLLEKTQKTAKKK